MSEFQLASIVDCMIIMACPYTDERYNMRRKGQVIAALVAIVVGIVTIITVVSYLNSRPTVALRTLLTLPGACDTLSPDWSLIANSGKIYDATTGQLRLTLKPSDTQVSFSPDSAYVAAPGDGVYDLRS